MYTKTHQGQLGKVTAICDEDIIGKKFEENEKQLEVSTYFYKDKKINEKETRILLKKAENLNLVGKETIKLALEEKIITKEHIIKIQGIPHAQCLK